MNERANRISRLLRDQKSRASYIKAKLGVLVPAQIRALRLKSDMPRQGDLAREAGMHQSRISMFETPGAANVTLETLARLAATFKTGLLVKFVPFSEMLRWENQFSQDQFNVLRLDEDLAFLDPRRVASDMFNESPQSHEAMAAGQKGQHPEMQKMHATRTTALGGSMDSVGTGTAWARGLPTALAANRLEA